MDNQDQRRTHTPGHESHGVNVCYKCGWSFPNRHPSAKQRRAHKKICGTIEGYKPFVSEEQTRLNGSDDEHVCVSDDDHKTPGPNTLDTGKNEKSNDGIGEKLVRSEDEVFSDAVADFSDSALSQGIKEPLQEDSLDSGVSQLIVKSSDDCQIQNPKNFQTERVEVGNTLEFQGQLSGCIVDPLPSSVADLRTEESTVVHSDDFFGLSSDSYPCEAQDLPDVFPENKIYAGENVRDCSLVSVAKETNLIGKDEMESDRDMVEFVDSSDKVVSETCEGVSDIVVSGAISLDHQVADEAVNLKEKNDAEFLSVLAQDDLPLESNSVVITNASTNDVQVESAHVKQSATSSDVNNLQEKREGNVNGETCEGVSDIAISGGISLDHQVVDGAVNLKEKNGAEFLSVLSQDDLPLESSPVVTTNASTNDVQVEFEGAIPFATSSDVKTLQEKGEGNVNADTPPTRDDRPDVPHPQSDYEDFKDQEGVVSQNPLSLQSSELLKHEEDDLKNSVTEENKFVFNPNQLTEKSDVLSPDMHVVSSTSSMKKELVNFEPMAEEMHVEEEHAEVSPVKLTVESFDRLDEIGESMNAMKTEMNESHTVHFSEEQGSVDVSSTSSMKKELVNFEPMAEEMHVEEEHAEVSPVKLTVESFDRLDEIGESMNAMKTEMNESHTVHFSEEQGSVDVCKDSQQISIPEGSLMASSNENPRDASFSSATSETTGVISIDNVSDHETNRTEINNAAGDGKGVRANVENDIGTKTEDLQSSDLLKLEAKQSSDLIKSDDAGEMGEIEKCDITDAQCRESHIVRDTSLSKSASSHIESPVISEAVIDGTARKSKCIECTDIGPISAAQKDIKEDEINSNIKVHEEYNRSVDPSADSRHAQDAELLVKAAENLADKYTSLSSLNIEPSAQHDSAVEENQDGEPGGEVSGLTAVPVQNQSVNKLVKHSSTGIDASVDSGSRCDSLEGNWGSVSVFSLQSDAPPVIDTETLPSTGSLASTEAGKSNVNKPKDASDRQQSWKSEMFEPPSFMTLVEAGHVSSPKAAASEVQKGPNPQQPNPTLQAGWFPTLTQVINESQGRKKNEEIIAKITNWSTTKEHTPLKSLLGQAVHSNKPKSPKLEERSVQKERLTTVNSILGPESPAAQATKGEVAKEWNSPARYPADIKKEKRKVKSRPLWIQLACCLSVDS